MSVNLTALASTLGYDNRTAVRILVENAPAMQDGDRHSDKLDRFQHLSRSVNARRIARVMADVDDWMSSEDVMTLCGDVPRGSVGATLTKMHRGGLVLRSGTRPMRYRLSDKAKSEMVVR